MGRVRERERERERVVGRERENLREFIIKRLGPMAVDWK